MSRTYEHFRQMDGDSIDWDARNEEDRLIQEALEAEPPTESRFETPASFVPVIPPVEKSGEYNSFDDFSEQEKKDWATRHFDR